MSSFTDYLNEKNAGSFEDYLSDASDISMPEISIDNIEGLDEQDRNTLKKILGSAKTAYAKAALNAKLAYSRAIQEAKSAYAKTAVNAKELASGFKDSVKKGSKAIADSSVKAKDFAVKELNETVEEIKENKELAIKVGVASAVATASAIGLAYLIFRKKK